MRGGGRGLGAGRGAAAAGRGDTTIASSTLPPGSDTRGPWKAGRSASPALDRSTRLSSGRPLGGSAPASAVSPYY